VRGGAQRDRSENCADIRLFDLKAQKNRLSSFRFLCIFPPRLHSAVAKFFRWLRSAIWKCRFDVHLSPPQPAPDRFHSDGSHSFSSQLVFHTLAARPPTSSEELLRIANGVNPCTQQNLKNPKKFCAGAHAKFEETVSQNFLGFFRFAPGLTPLAIRTRSADEVGGVSVGVSFQCHLGCWRSPRWVSLRVVAKLCD
jgi:hypothetical protein